jgi:hypothetical protein
MYNNNLLTIILNKFMKETFKTLALIGALTLSTADMGCKKTDNNSPDSSITSAETTGEEYLKNKDHGREYRCTESPITGTEHIKGFRKETQKVLNCEPVKKEKNTCPVELEVDGNNQIISDVWC